MAPRRRTSRKRSAASSTGASLSRAAFYLDESIYSRNLAERLRAADAEVHHPGEAFDFGTPDAEWLDACGRRKWIVLTRDMRIRHRPLEIASLTAAGVAAFAFTAGQATAVETSSIVIRIAARMIAIAISEPRPFLYTFGRSGRFTRIRLRR